MQEEMVKIFITLCICTENEPLANVVRNNRYDINVQLPVFQALHVVQLAQEILLHPIENLVNIAHNIMKLG